MAGSLAACGNETPITIGVAGFQVDGNGVLEVRIALCRGELETLRLNDLDKRTKPADQFDSGRWERVDGLEPGVHTLNTAEPGDGWRTVRQPDADADPAIDHQVFGLGPIDDSLGGLRSRMTGGETLANLGPGQVTGLDGDILTPAEFDAQCDRP